MEHIDDAMVVPGNDHMIHERKLDGQALDDLQVLADAVISITKSMEPQKQMPGKTTNHIATFKILLAAGSEPDETEGVDPEDNKTCPPSLSSLAGMRLAFPLTM